MTEYVSVVGADAAAVETIGRYVDANDETAVVFSCAIYQFDGDMITSITSYTVELPSV